MIYVGARARRSECCSTEERCALGLGRDRAIGDWRELQWERPMFSGDLSGGVPGLRGQSTPAAPRSKRLTCQSPNLRKGPLPTPVFPKGSSLTCQSRFTTGNKAPHNLKNTVLRARPRIPHHNNAHNGATTSLSKKSPNERAEETRLTIRAAAQSEKRTRLPGTRLRSASQFSMLPRCSLT